MKGPKKIVKTLFRHKSKDIRSHNSCKFCEDMEAKACLIPGFHGRQAEGFEYFCGHKENPFINQHWFLISPYRNIDDNTKVETPNWCPYWDSNNKRKVLFEKDMNKNEK